MEKKEAKITCLAALNILQLTAESQKFAQKKNVLTE